MALQNADPGAQASAAGALRTVDAIDAGEPTTALSAGKGRRYGAQERWRARNPLAAWSHGATRAALRRGLLVRGVCEVCGSAKTDAHHPDHRQPLKVRWLCRRHHKALHAAGQGASE
jgi:hypothetical protein